jgi:hypothetical protein
MAQQNDNIDNLSDVMPSAGTNTNVSPQQLPIRGEKRIISSPISPQNANTVFEKQYAKSQVKPPFPWQKYSATGDRTQLVEQDDFNIKAALSPYTDYVLVRLYNRGLGGNGTPDGNPAVYRFLINPSQVVVNRTTLDGQAFARAGWQIGVWGEDSLSINLTGKTAGQYFAFGNTDRYQPFTESYRNLEQLQVVFENNGYWFEGEQAAEGPLAADFARRIIKMHADVELIVGNFMWSGMFESLTLSQNADMPFLVDFQISFVAWKERFRKGSPYKDTIHNDVKRGHDYGSWRTTALAVQQEQQSYSTDVVALAPNVPTISAELPNELIPPASVPLVAPSVTSAAASQTDAQVDATANDTSVTAPVIKVNQPIVRGDWLGVLSPRPFGGIKVT